MTKLFFSGRSFDSEGEQGAVYGLSIQEKRQAACATPAQCTGKPRPAVTQYTRRVFQKNISLKDAHITHVKRPMT